jgi:hypothetical protein
MRKSLQENQERIGRNLGKFMWVCNTIPSLRVNFQAVNVWIIELGVLTEHHPEVDSRVFL